MKVTGCHVDDDLVGGEPLTRAGAPSPDGPVLAAADPPGAAAARRRHGDAADAGGVAAQPQAGGGGRAAEALPGPETAVFGG